jgi:hypothetical protein
MRLLIRTLAVAALALLLVFAVMPAMSNGGLLDGLEFLGMLGMSAVCAVAWFFARPRVTRRPTLWFQSLLVGLAAPWVVLLAPLVFCIFFLPNASCM